MNQERQYVLRLARLKKAARRRALALGVVRAGAVLLPAAVAALWAVSGPAAPGPVLGGGLALSLVALALLLIRDLLWKPWRTLASPGDVAARVEEVRPCRNLVRAAAEPPAAWDGDDPVARELRRRVVARAAGILDGITAADLAQPFAARPVAAGWALGLVMVLALLATGPEQFTLGWRRLAGAAEPGAAPRIGGMYAASGPAFAVEGEAVVLRARDFGGGDDPAVCEIRVGAGQWRPLAVSAVAPEGYEGELLAPFHDFQAPLDAAREDLEWRFRRGPRVTAIRSLAVLHPPLLIDLAGRVIPPDYTRAPAHDLEILPTVVEAPSGGVLRLTGRTNLPVTRAVIATTAGDSIAMATDSLALRGDLPLAGDTEFRILLTDRHGLRNRDPLLYKVVALPDEKPAVRLDRPDDDGILPLGGHVSLVVEAADDFGLDTVRLLVRPRGMDGVERGWRGGGIWPVAGDSVRSLQSLLGPWAVRVLTDQGDPGAPKMRQEIDVDLAALDLGAGQGLEIVAEARDNRRPGQGQKARSRVLTLVLPAAAEVLAEHAREQESRTAELEDARRRTRQLGRDLDRLNRELMKNPQPDWTRRQEMTEAIARRRELQKELQDMAAKLQEELDRLAANQMTGEKQMEMAEQISQLLSQQDSPFLESLMRKLESRPEDVSPQDLARTLQEVARNQQDLARRLDMALSQIDRLDQEQKMEGMTALLEKIMRDQQDLAERSRALAEKTRSTENQDNQGDQGKQGEKGEEKGDQGHKGEQGEKGDKGDQGEKSDQGRDGKQGEQGEQKEDGKPGDRTDDEAARKEAEDLARRQQELTAQLQELQEQLESARKEAEERANQDPQSGEASRQMQQTLQEMLDQLKQQQSRQKMEQAQEQLQEMDPQQAAEMQEQALRDLGSLYHVLLQSQQAMQMAMKQNQVVSLRRIAAELLDLSARQEQIAQRVPSRLRNVRAREITRGQHRMQQAAIRIRDELAELSTEAPLRILPLLKKLDGLIETMGYSVNSLEEGQGMAAQRQSADALSQANRIVIGLLTEAQMNSSGQGQGQQSQPSLAEKLMQMIREQAGLNGMTEELRRMLADRGLSQAARARMKRLGEEQGQLAGRMRDLAEKERVRPDSGRLLGDLDRLAEDLETISREIDQGMVSEETLRRQERILSRMLDARNSVRQRDFSMRRESRTAGEVYGDPQLGTTPGESGRDRLRLRYRSLDAAPPDYQSLVRRYFSALDSLQRLQELPQVREDMP